MRTSLLALTLLPLASAQSVDFTRDVQPILAKRCSACHGAGQQMAGLRLDSGDAVQRVVAPGHAADSKLIERVESTKKGFGMPPVGAPLSANEIATLRSWIDQGAKAPKATGGKGTHWSFQPIQRPAGDSIDFFIRARLKAEHIEPSPAADRRTLIRRVSLDLTGLPPTPEETEAFLADQRPNAYERLIDRLLASPHYGEKWARHWLDLAHYADSDGYEKDQVRPYAWRYRDWVINALNSDMPFDQFTTEQLAGDLLPHATTEQRVATGFLRNTLTNREAGVDRAEAKFEQLINRTNTVSTTWLGLTMGCSQCHNHKYDPILQKDYYAMFAFFESAEEKDIDAPVGGETGTYLSALPEYTSKRSAVLNEGGISALFTRWQARAQRAFEHQSEDLEWDFAVVSFRAMYDKADRFLTQGITKLSPREQDLLLTYFLGNPGPGTLFSKEERESIKTAKDKLAALTLPPYAIAPVMAQNPDAMPTRIHIGGDYKNVGDALQPAPPIFLPPWSAQRPSRLELAKWLVARDNPLTARVAVNRMWQEFFGRGLVLTAEDFGTQGDPPTHPELLDWLASEFRDNGWSMKALQRKIVLSQTYQQSSHSRPELEARDPENTLLARQSRLRLPAELIRDEALATSGLLSAAIGGHSVRPPQPAGVAEMGYGGSVKWKESTGPDRYRRGLYIHYQRTTPYPFLSSFDAPEPQVACARRRRSNTPLQSLNLLNDPVFFEAAQTLALRALQEPTFAERLDAVYEVVLARKPSATERTRMASYLDQQMSALHSDERAAWTGISRVLLNLDEFMTRE